MSKIDYEILAAWSWSEASVASSRLNWLNRQVASYLTQTVSLAVYRIRQ